MKIGAAGLMKLAEMICGDAPFDFSPYSLVRSGSLVPGSFWVVLGRSGVGPGYAPDK